MKIQQVDEILDCSNVQILTVKLGDFKQHLRALTVGEVDYEVSEEADLVKSVFKRYPNGEQWLKLWMNIEEVTTY